MKSVKSLFAFFAAFGLQRVGASKSTPSRTLMRWKMAESNTTRATNMDVQAHIGTDSVPTKPTFSENEDSTEAAVVASTGTTQAHITTDAVPMKPAFTENDYSTQAGAVDQNVLEKNDLSLTRAACTNNLILDCPTKQNFWGAFPGDDGLQECQQRCRDLQVYQHFVYWPTKGGCRCCVEDGPTRSVTWDAYSGDLDASCTTPVDPCEQACDHGTFFFKDLTFPSAPSCSCQTDCPKGYTNGQGANGGECMLCNGQVSADRTQCNMCPNGEVSKPDSDACANIQDACEPTECNACSTCIDAIGASAATCSQTDGCFDPGYTWCSTALSALFDCKGNSMECWYKLLCHSSCVCPMWKVFMCGSKSSSDNVCPEKFQQRAALISNSTSVSERDEMKQQASSGQAAPFSLDESLSDKRSC